MTRDQLGGFEQLVLLAILRLGDAAYAPAIVDEIDARTGRAPAAGAVYVTLDRLEAKGLVRSRLAGASPERGGRPRRYVTVTARGVKQLRASRDALLAMWQGVDGAFEGA